MLSKKVRRCSGMILTQRNLLAAVVVSRFENDRLGAEKRKLKKDMDNHMKENIKFNKRFRKKEKVNTALLNLTPDEKCELRIIHDVRRENTALQNSGNCLEPSWRSGRLRKSEHFKPKLRHGTAQYYLECYGPPPSNLFAAPTVSPSGNEEPGLPEHLAIPISVPHAPLSLKKHPGLPISIQPPRPPMCKPRARLRHEEQR